MYAEDGDIPPFALPRLREPRLVIIQYTIEESAGHLANLVYHHQLVRLDIIGLILTG